MDVFRRKFTATAALIVAGIVWSPSLSIPAAANTMLAGPGCANVWAFNGVWRVRVTGFAPHMDGGRQTGWDVTETWRNGTGQQLNGPRDSFQKGQVLRLQGGGAIDIEDNTPSVLSQQALDFHVFPPSAQYTHAQLFAANTIDPNSKPESVVITFDTGKLAKATDLPKFTVSPPDFTIKFDCSPAELAKATAAAQGGSYEVQAHEGCANQGVSDGNWSVRVTRVELGSDSGQSTPTGWNITEEWKNLSGRKLAPSGTWMFDQQLVLANGDTMGAGTLAQLGAHDFAPGESMTYTQPFRAFRESFDQNTKPAKLLLTFNAKLYPVFSTPKYSGTTPNIRIKLNCGG